MKMYSVAIGAGIGYLAGNQQARKKTADLLHQLKASPQAKAVEDKLTEKATTLKAKTTGGNGIDLSDSRYGSGAIPAVEPEVFTPGRGAGQIQTRPSMVPH